jgi:putative IMPACT (imprinted ancient) family translation regulator
MTLKRERSTSPVPSLAIYHSDRIIEQTSSFIAAFSPSLSVKALQNLPEFSSATHRITAWRIRSRQKSLVPEKKVLYDLGFDDDGEKWAGSRLQHVLAETGAEGVVVVARWYGGQNIGPVRFTHIEDSAKKAIRNWKVANEEALKEASIKKQKLEEKTVRKELEQNLRERDLNIFVLRKLLADKNAELNDLEPAPPTPQKAPPNYETMSMEALKRVDKARDASIAFILKQIDKVDEQLKLVNAPDDTTEDSWKDAEERQEPVESASQPRVKKDTPS